MMKLSRKGLASDDGKNMTGTNIGLATQSIYLMPLITSCLKAIRHENCEWDIQPLPPIGAPNYVRF